MLRMAFTSLLAMTVGACTTQQHATPEEVLDRVQAASALLAAEGEDGLKTLRDPSSPFTWKDTYVFVVDCGADKVLANPAFPARQGGDIKQHTDYAGMRYGPVLCAVAQKPGGGWLDYVWLPRGGAVPKRKVSYVVTVPGSTMQVGAGVYNDDLTLAELTALTEDTTFKVEFFRTP